MSDSNLAEEVEEHNGDSASPSHSEERKKSSSPAKELEQLEQLNRGPAFRRWVKVTLETVKILLWSEASKASTASSVPVLEYDFAKDKDEDPKDDDSKDEHSKDEHSNGEATEEANAENGEMLGNFTPATKRKCESKQASKEKKAKVEITPAVESDIGVNHVHVPSTQSPVPSSGVPSSGVPSSDVPSSDVASTAIAQPSSSKRKGGIPGWPEFIAKRPASGSETSDDEWY
ncbi:hypothetical protein BT63DRAFT_440143 [Microthyrium microscopicum]|uniref:Uncharacterized protein n=1 Tax=Microthyrium microscopicum TaxID=703497 RepID=A0A6A6UDG7_9PEZI|nr:hypothetical protein BT63DRAFT_440143 [Microthyrium microscopicum]